MLALTRSPMWVRIRGRGIFFMLHLALLRHANAAHGAYDARDFDRPLSAHGRKAAVDMGGHLRNRDFAPERILCSPARRARATLECLGEGFANAPGLEFPEEFYLAAPGTLLARVAATGNARSVLVVAHNPGLEDLANELASRGAGATGAQTALARGFATTALAIFEVDGVNFSNVHHEIARLIHFASPGAMP